MVLSTENNYYTNIISPVMLLVAPISGLTVNISRFSLDPTIAYIHQHLFKIYYFQFEHCYDTSQTYILSNFINLTQVHNFTVSAQDLFTFRRLSVFTVSFTGILQLLMQIMKRFKPSY